MKAVVVIPARLHSVRLPRKLLLNQTGKYLIQHTYENASRARRASDVIIATDICEIRDTVIGFSGKVVLTSEKHQTGTDRVAEAAAGIDADIIVNVQGDEPEIDPGCIDTTIKLLEENDDASISTLATPFADERELQDTSKVKVLLDKDGYAIYFSRIAIPYRREDSELSFNEIGYLRHLGIYGYRRACLLEFSKASRCIAERAEKLEQLRAVYNGARIVVAVVEKSWPGIDTEDDYRRFLHRMKPKEK